MPKFEGKILRTSKNDGAERIDRWKIHEFYDWKLDGSTFEGSQSSNEMAGKPTIHSRAECWILNGERTQLISILRNLRLKFHNVIRIWYPATLIADVWGENIEIFYRLAKSTLLRYWIIRPFPSNFLQMNIFHLNPSSLHFKTMRDSKIWTIAANNRKWDDDFFVQNQNGRIEQTSQPSNSRPNWIQFELWSISYYKIIEKYLKGLDSETSLCNISKKSRVVQHKFQPHK